MCISNRLYRDPDEVDAENGVAAKLERSAAQGRSPIRREPSIRPSREIPSPSGFLNITRYRHEMRQARMRTERDLEDSDGQIEALEAELTRLRQLRTARGRAHPRTAHRESRTRPTRPLEDISNEPNGNSLPNDVFLAEVPSEPISPELHSSENVILPRPIRESNLRFVSGTDPDRSISLHSPRFSMPSPPHSLRGVARSRPVDGPLPETWETTPPYTQDFAPARAARAAMASNSSASVASPRPSSAHHPGLETPPPDAYEGSSRLRRVPHLSPQLLPRITVDGLGDRHRSPTESLELLEEESWNNLLATMETRPLSATTSMTDSFATSRTNSQQSGATSATSFGEIGLTAEDTCDLPPGITEEDVRPLRERHRRDAGRVRAPRRYARNADDYGQASDSALSILIREARESRERAQRRNDEIMMARAITERQQNRGHVPEEWWALAGLPAVLGSPPAEP